MKFLGLDVLPQHLSFVTHIQSFQKNKIVENIAFSFLSFFFFFFLDEGEEGTKEEPDTEFPVRIVSCFCG